MNIVKSKMIYFFFFIMAAMMILGGCDKSSQQTENSSRTENEITREETDTADKRGGPMRIKIEASGNEIIFELNDSKASKDLYSQLPLTTENEDFSNNEKTFYPPKKLDISDAPFTDGSIGTLAYYEPWGDVVLFYGSYESNNALYSLGTVVSGSEFISEISGEMIISPEE